MLLEKTGLLSDYVLNYRNTLEHNDRIFTEFTANTNKLPLLKEHKDYIVRNSLGFGDRAFHYMWYLVLNDLKKKEPPVRMLEIGVYKGQVISLWSLLCRELDIQSEITAVTPLDGTIPRNRLFNNKYVNKLKLMFSPKFRKCVAEGNNYLKDDYKSIITGLFRQYNLRFDAIRLLKGFSNDPKVLAQVKGEKFDLIYIDGDHSYDGVISDINNYTPLLQKGGYLVMDDASFFLEGSKFPKGHKEVSRACSIIEGLGFENILNVGHNRIYRKI